MQYFLFIVRPNINLAILIKYINAEIIIEDEKGEKSIGRIAKINANQIIIDLNHPLAGKTLTYNIEILNISDGHPVH